MDLKFQSAQELFQFLLLGVLIVFTLILLVVVMNIFFTLKTMINEKNGIETKPFSMASFWDRMNNLRPMKEEATIMLDHDYDGIKELDNHLPPWWLGMFYGAMVFAVIYMLNYHVWQSSPLSGEEYEIAMAEAKTAKAEKVSAGGGTEIDENNVTLATETADLETGKVIYEGNCAVCHGNAGEGGVGPNLTDEFWLHGGSVKNLFSTIKYGVPEKGMIAWQATLKPADMRSVASYILTMQGSNPPNGKAPQGEKYVPEATEEAPATVEQPSKELSKL